MGNLISTTTLEGRSASNGIGFGYCLRLSVRHTQRVVGSPDEELEAFTNTVTKVSERLANLISGANKLGAEILAFQAMLLEDESILKPVYLQIENGVAADKAWNVVLEAETAEYEGSDDEYISARASDFEDLRIRVLNALTGVDDTLPAANGQSVLVADRLGPSTLLEIDWNSVTGIALARDSATGHAAILARSFGIPMVVGVEGIDRIDDCDPIIVDGDSGKVILGGKDELTDIRDAKVAAMSERIARESSHAIAPAVRKSGQRVRVLLNVDSPIALERADPGICDGIGLVRTEFLFANRSLPSEDVQYHAYRNIVKWSKGRPVTIRTLDAGGDKPDSRRNG